MRNNIDKKIKNALNYIITFLKWSVIAALTGAVSGFVGTVFHVSIEAATSMREYRPSLIYFLPFAGLFIVALYKITNMLENKGTDAVISSVRDDEGKVPFLLAPLIFVSTFITHLFGGSAGREGAALQLGGSMGSMIGELISLDDKDMHIIVMCGMSGMFSALFGTPLAAVFFALEVISVGVIYYSGLIPCLVASIVAYALSVLCGVEPTRFAIAQIPEYSSVLILKTVGIAILCAVLSMVFCIAMHGTAKYLRRAFKNEFLRIFIGGAVIVALTRILGSTDYNGAGMNIIEAAVTEGRAEPFAWALKIIFTAVTIGAGYKGGEIVPTLFIGATFGCALSHVFGVDPTFGAAVGIVALFCGVVNCPIASIMLSIELFGAHGILFFAVAAGVSYMLSGYYGLYHSQKIMYSKLRAEYINKDTI